MGTHLKPALAFYVRSPVPKLVKADKDKMTYSFQIRNHIIRYAVSLLVSSKRSPCDGT